MDSSIDINTIFSQQGIAQLLSDSREIVLALLLGGTIVGIIAGLLAYFISYAALKGRQTDELPGLQPSTVMSGE
jgi:hypothetical protein